MDLLRRQQVPDWLLRKFGSVNQLAVALNMSRQTAHNLLTGRTIPSYETCQRLGLEVVFLEVPEAERTKSNMESLNDFLSRRSVEVQAAESEIARQALLKGASNREFDEFIKSLGETIAHVGPIDGRSFEWGQLVDVFLKFGNVAASLKYRSGSEKFNVVFGQIPGAIYASDHSPSTDVWEIELDVVGSQFLWNVIGGSGKNARGLNARVLAEQVIRRLIEYKDEYENFFRRRPF